MYKINDQFNTQDLGKALLGEQGIFEAVSPTGQRFRVEAQHHASGHSIVSLTCPENPGNWNVTKVAELNRETSRAAGTGS